MIRGVLATGLRIAVAYATALAVPTLAYVGLASGYSFEAFGVWQPPNTAMFRSVMTWGCLVMLAVCLIVSVLGLIFGVGWMRLAYLPPLLLGGIVAGYIMTQWMR